MYKLLFPEKGYWRTCTPELAAQAKTHKSKDQSEGMVDIIQSTSRHSQYTISGGSLVLAALTQEQLRAGQNVASGEHYFVLSCPFQLN